jgi:hypothetical protein
MIRAKLNAAGTIVLACVVVTTISVGVFSRGVCGAQESTSRGAGQPESAGRILRFPTDRALGILYVVPVETLEPFTFDVAPAWRKVGEARGLVNLPPKVLVRLDVSRAAIADLSPLERLEPDALDMLNLLPLGLKASGLRYVGHLKGLRSLYINGAYIANLDRRLAHIAGLPRLERLVIQIGAVSEDGLKRICRLKSLRELILDFTIVTDDGLRALASLTRLERLTFEKAMDEHGLTQLRSPQSLRYLNIREITNVGLAEIAGLAHLEFLEVQGDRITDEGLASVARLPKLKSLVIGQPKMGLSDAGLVHLTKLPALEVLSIKSGRFSVTGLEHVGRICGLKKLAIHVNNLRDAGLAHLADLAQLEDLSLHNETRAPKSVNLDAIEQIARIKALKRLQLTRFDLRGPGLPALGSLPALESLQLTDADLTYEDLRHLQKFPALREFGWSTFPDETDPGRPTVRPLLGLTSLTALELPGQKQTKAGQAPRGAVAWDASQLSDLAGFPKLQQLNLRGRITDEGLKQLAPLTGLVSLKIWDADVTDEGLRLLAGMSALEYLGIAGSITDKGIGEFADFESLKVLFLYLHGPLDQKIMKAAIEKLRAQRPSLIYTHPFNGDQELMEEFSREQVRADPSRSDLLQSHQPERTQDTQDREE